MTTSELITLLQAYPSSAQVEFSDGDGECPIDDVEEEAGTVYLVSGEAVDDDEEGENDE